MTQFKQLQIDDKWLEFLRDLELSYESLALDATFAHPSKDNRVAFVYRTRDQRTTHLDVQRLNIAPEHLEYLNGTHTGVQAWENVLPPFEPQYLKLDFSGDTVIAEKMCRAFGHAAEDAGYNLSSLSLGICLDRYSKPDVLIVPPFAEVRQHAGLDDRIPKLERKYGVVSDEQRV